MKALPVAMLVLALAAVQLSVHISGSQPPVLETSAPMLRACRWKDRL